MDPHPSRDRRFDPWILCFSLLLLLPSLLLLSGWLLFLENPLTLARLEARILGFLDFFRGPLLPSILALLALAALLWPTTLPALRVWFSGIRDRMRFDRKTAGDLLDKVRHFASVPDLQKLAQCYLDGRQPGLALPFLEEARRRDPTEKRTLYLLGRALWLAGRPEQAAPFLEEALAGDPEIGFGEGMRLGVRVLFAAGRFEACLEMAGRYSRRFGERPEILYLEALARERTGAPEEARRVLARIRELLPPARKGKKGRWSPEDDLARARARLRLLGKGGR